MVSHHSAKFGDHRHCGSGDIMFLAAEEENSRCSRFNPPLLFISKGHESTWQRSKQQLDKTLKITFASLSRKSDKKKKRKKNKNGNCKAFCVSHKRNKRSVVDSKKKLKSIFICGKPL